MTREHFWGLKNANSLHLHKNSDDAGENVFGLRMLSKVEAFEKETQTNRSVNVEDVFYQSWSTRKSLVWTRNYCLPVNVFGYFEDVLFFAICKVVA